MKLSEHWLREWINPAVDINQLAEQLTMAGLEVEGIEPVTLTFTNVIVARVDSVSAHPDADKLRLCKVNTGSETIDVVCGAPNVRKGMLAALAQVGARLPGIGNIKAGKIRGVISQGMLCSAADLGLSEDAEGLIELPEDSKPGQPLSELLTIKDNIIEVSLTPNRGDCLSVFGLARELSVIHGIGINTPLTESIKAEHREQRKIHLEASAACPHYAGRVITGVDSGKTTPLWMQERLERSGIRCINVVVDITNYVMMSLGQPMHAFDNDCLNGDIHVRFAHEGETLTLLDHQECAFSNEVLLITDDTQALAMAGIMGGLDSAVTKGSQNIFLESACFAPTSIIGQARRYSLHSESSHRFERGVDFTLQVRAIDMATSLILSICGGSPGPVTESSAEEYLPIRDEIELRKDQIIRVLGIDIEPAAVTRILSSLGMQVIETATGWTVVPPSWRFDIAIEADLIEELARIHGYDQIPGTVPLIPMHVQTQQHEYQQLQRMRNLLVNRDYQEAITYSFVDQALQRRITPGEMDLELINPIASDLAVMRTSLLPGLLRALIFNINRQQGRIRLFEYGLVFHQEGSSVQQFPVIGGIVYGNTYEKQWHIDDMPTDYFDIKGDVEALLCHCGHASTILSFRPLQHPALHPGQSAQVYIEEQAVGFVGALHPTLQSSCDLARPAYVFELEIRRILQYMPAKFKKISKFPAVKRDLAIVLDEGIPAARVLECIRSGAPEYLINLQLFDVYQGEGIDLGKKSLALGLTFQGSSSTLTEADIEAVMGDILARLGQEIGATLRE